MHTQKKKNKHSTTKSNTSSRKSVYRSHSQPKDRSIFVRFYKVVVSTIIYQNKLVFQRNNVIPIIIFLFTLIIYTYNLLPGVYGGDSGDFLTAIVTKGVPHPSGYPLYTMLGILLNSILPGDNPALKVGALSALFASFCVVTAYFIMHELTNNKWLSFTGCLTLAFSYPFWLYAEVVEVFSLHTLFILTIILALIKFIKSSDNNHIYLLIFICGLSLTNNQAILLVFPIVGFIILLKKTKVLLEIKTVLVSLLIFFVALSPYLYIPLVSLRNPSVNWSGEATLDNFIKTITRFDYGGNKLPIPNTETHIFKTNIQPYLIYFKHYVTPLPIFTSLMGLIILIFKRKNVESFILVSSFLLTGPFYVFLSGAVPINFGVLAVVERFYLPSITILYLTIPISLSYLLEIKHKSKIIRKLLLFSSYLISTLLLLINFVNNFKRTNLRIVNIGEAFAYDILTVLPEKTLLLVHDDSISFNSLYLTKGLNFRNDIIIPGKYNYQDNMIFLEDAGFSDDKAKKTIQNFRNSVDNNLYYSSLPSLLNKGHSIFSDLAYTIQDTKYGNTISIPSGLLYKIELENNYKLSVNEYFEQSKQIFENYQTNFFSDYYYLVSENLIFQSIAQLYVRGYLSTSEFILKHYNDIERSKYFYNKAYELSLVIY